MYNIPRTCRDVRASLWQIPLVLLLFAIVAHPFSSHAQTVGVPNVVGLDADDAAAKLQAANLRAVARVQADEKGTGRVVRQDPPGNTKARAGSEVLLIVTLPTTVTVPRVIGLEAKQAVVRVREAFLSVSPQMLRMESEEPEGRVVKQQPEQGAKVKRGTDVTLTLAAPMLATVPTVTGLRVADAEARIREGRLQLAQRPMESDEDEGKVLQQDPAAGRRVPAGTRVSVVVATAVLVQVPNVVGSPIGEAVGRIRTAQLVPSPQEGRQSLTEEGRVLDQEPRADTRVKRGTQVRLTFARPVLVTVPNVVGSGTDAALRAIEEVHLRAQSPLQRRESDGVEGAVLEQSPEAGRNVKAGTAVSLVVAVPAMVTIPKLLGETLSDAQTMLNKARLSLAAPVQYIESDAVEGTVLRQDPGPEKRVKRGSTVALEVAKRKIVEAVPPKPPTPPIDQRDRKISAPRDVDPAPITNVNDVKGSDSVSQKAKPIVRPAPSPNGKPAGDDKGPKGPQIISTASPRPVTPAPSGSSSVSSDDAQAKRQETDAMTAAALGALGMLMFTALTVWVLRKRWAGETAARRSLDEPPPRRSAPKGAAVDVRCDMRPKLRSIELRAPQPATEVVFRAAIDSGTQSFAGEEPEAKEDTSRA